MSIIGFLFEKLILVYSFAESYFLYLLIQTDKNKPMI